MRMEVRSYEERSDELGILASVRTPALLELTLIFMRLATLVAAKNNLEAEGLATFEDQLEATRKTWTRYLSKINPTGFRTESQRRTYFSALYRSLLSPYAHSDADGRMKSTVVDFTYYTFLSTWDTFR